MECFALFLLLLVGCFVTAAAVGERLFRRRRRRRFFRELAKHFAGAYDAGGLFSRPAIRLRYGETWAIVTECQSAGPFFGAALQVRVAWPHSHVRCEIIASPTFPVAHDVRHSWPAVVFDHDDFGKKFVITSTDEPEIRQLLTAGVQWQIERLRKITADERLYVLIRDGQLIVQKPWRSPRTDQPIPFVQGVLELYDQCMLAKASGIQFLHTDEAQTLDQVVCKVCGESIVTSLVYCQRCKTPHHQDCWHYIGTCSVYGCREKDYLTPQQSHAVQPPPAN